MQTQMNIILAYGSTVIVSMVSLLASIYLTAVSLAVNSPSCYLSKVRRHDLEARPIFCYNNNMNKSNLLTMTLFKCRLQI